MLIDLVAPPSLADGFAASRVAPVFVAYAADELPSPRPGLSSVSEIDVVRFQTQHRRGRTGVVVYTVGAVAAFVGLPAYSLGASFGDPNLAIGGVVIATVGVGALIVGEVLLFSGGISGAHTLGISNTAGWVGVGLAIGGLVVPPLGVAGLICGAVQLGQNGRAARQIGAFTVHVVPRPDGIAVAGTF